MAKKNTQEISKDAAEYKTGLRKWLPIAILSLAMMIIIVDTTVLNVSLKAIVNDLHTNLQGLQWVISGYALTLAALTITGGRLGDLFGRKKMFVTGAIIFAIGSFITSISHSIGVMIAGEAVIEGIGAALMLPATASLLVANYKGHDRAIAFGVWGGVAGASSAIGPIIGGFLTTNYSWRWAFRINIIVAIVLVLSSLLIAESFDRAEKRELDFVGIFLSSFGLLSLVYGIIEASTYGWLRAQHAFSLFGHAFSPANLSVTPIAIVTGIILLILFGFWERSVERRGRTPLVSLSLLRNKQFTSGTMVITLLSLGMVGLIFALPVFLQSAQNLDALHTGYALIPLSLAVLIMAPMSAALSKRIAPKHLIQVGLLFAILASAVLRYALVPTATAASLAPGLILFGIGMGLVMAQVSNIALSAVSVQQSGEASGVNNTLRQVGSSFGSAIIGAVVLTTLASSLAAGVTNSTVIPENMRPQIARSVASQASAVELGGSGSDKAVNSLPAPIQKELKRIAIQASSDGSRRAMIYTGAAITAGFGVSFLLPNKKNLAHHTDEVPAGH